MKIKSIYIDGLHNAVNKTYDFGTINYIYGNNGVGKSTILQAIQLALLGYIPGTAKNTREALLRHSPCNKIDVRVTIVDTSGQEITIERKIEEKVTKVITIPDGYDISSIISAIELPIFNFNEFVGQTANKLKEYFIKNILPTADGRLNWEQILAESIADCNFTDKQAIIDYGMSLINNLESVDVLDQVIEANTKFKAEQSFNKTEQQRLQNTVESLIYYEDYNGPVDMTELNAQILSVGMFRDQLLKYNSAVAATQSAKDELTRISAQIEALGGRAAYDEATKVYPQLQDKRKTYEADISARQQEIAAQRSAISNMEALIRSEGICTYTKESCKAIQAKIDALRNDLVTKKAEVVEAVAQLDAVVSEYNTCCANMRACEVTLQQFNTLWDKMTVLQKTVNDLPAKPETDKTIEELTAEYDRLTDCKNKLQANIQYNETIENITKLKYDAELHGKALAAWVKKTDTNGLQTTLMEKPFEELAQVMTTYIQEMYGRKDIKAHFHVSNKANSFSFGLLRQDVYIPYDLLSSGEKCLYTLALMICIVKNTQSPLKLLLCDDMFDHLDSQAIESTFAALRATYGSACIASGIQFIFAGVKDCNNAKDIMIQP